MDSMTSELDHKTFTTRGHLRTYLGFAPGVGKTYSMLAEGQRRAEGGERVVIGWIERHGRSETKAQLRDLDVIARVRHSTGEAPFPNSTWMECGERSQSGPPR